MVQDNFSWLTEWYLCQCDGDWEHQFGVRIDTLDNPGWSLTIDLERTSLESSLLDPVLHNVNPENELSGRDGNISWYVCKVENRQFISYGGPKDLVHLIETFRRFAEEQSGHHLA
jgi:hypothetical protein